MNWATNSKQSNDSKTSKLDALFKRTIESRDDDDGLYNDWTSSNDEDDDDCEIFNDN